MAWQWVGGAVEHTTTNNVVRSEDGLRITDTPPPQPTGDGWKPNGDAYLMTLEEGAPAGEQQATVQRWRRSIRPTRGYCGRCQDQAGLEEIPL